MAKRFCVNCGQPYDSDEVRSQRYFCINCGQPLSQQEWEEILAQRSARKPVPKKKKTWLIPVIAAVCLLLCLAVGFGVYRVFFAGSADDSQGRGSSLYYGETDRDEEEEPEEEPEAPTATPIETEEAAAPEETMAAEVPATQPPVVTEPAPTQPPAPYAQQEIRVTANGSDATLTLYTWEDGQWIAATSEFSARIGDNGISYNKREGDHCTPAGTFDVLFAFGIKDITTNLEYVKLSSGAVWVDDSDSKYYNTLQYSSRSDRDWSSAETTYEKFSGGASEACICFAFNGDCRSENSAVSGAGSAVFIDGVRDFSKVETGYGDIKISDADMRALLLLLDADKHPVIIIE